MTSNKPISKGTNGFANRQCVDTRTNHSIRFSKSEWKAVEVAASTRDDSPGEFVRNAALAAAIGDAGSVEGTLPRGLVRLIESTYRGVYFVAALKREELVREGRHEEIDRTHRDARLSQSDLLASD